MSAPSEAPVRLPSSAESSHLHLVEPHRETASPQPSGAASPRRAGSGVLWARAYRARLLRSDAFVIGVALTAGLAVSAEPSRILPMLVGFTPLAWTGLAVVGVTWMILLQGFRTRDRRVLGSGPDEYKRVITACMTAFGLLSTVLLVVGFSIPGHVAALTLIVGLLGLLVSRWLWRRWLTGQRKRGHALSRALVVGSPAEVEYVVSQITGSASAVFDIVGVVTTPNAGASMGFDDAHAGGFGPALITRRAAEVEADTVIVAGDHRSGNDFIRHLAWQLEGTAAELVLASRLANVAGPRIHFRPIEGLPLIHVEIPQFDGGKHLIKRGLDIAVSAVALVILAPVFLVLAVLIRMDSPGGAFFSQTRVGRNLETFRMYKFRSMVADAPDRLAELVDKNEGSGVLFKLKNDPRVTPIGRIIRKYSLDELPQIWNVLMGDMSLVGPRPPLPREVQSYRGKINRRMYIKPGLTGMWQISGRSNLSSEDSTRLDLYYVENWSVVGDLIIMWRTVKVVLKPVGAY